VHTDKTPQKNTTIQERAKFALHKLRHISITLALLCKESFQISRNDTIERVLFGIPRPVDVLDRHEHIAECKPLHICPGNDDNKLQRAMSEKSGWAAITNRVCFGFSDF